MTVEFGRPGAKDIALEAGEDVVLIAGRAGDGVFPAQRRCIFGRA
jgi:hypothetical protein